MKKIVKKNDGNIPVDDILCTTYQMRNFYLQLRDGFFTDLDIMNYIQHYKAVKMMKKNYNVLDVCCGRSMLLPLMRYHSKDINKYIGVDISKNNIKINQDIRNGKAINPKTYYPFKTEIIISNVANMSSKIKDKIHFVVYTSAIEHMHKTYGEQSIKEIAKVLVPNGKLFISCPNTPENQDGYNVRYKAHVYEWKISELKQALKEDFIIEKVIGLTGDLRKFKKALKKMPPYLVDFYSQVIDYFPIEFLKPLLYSNIPEQASEVLIIARRKKCIK